ncbi:MAG TPA: hypothetical protein VJN18_14835 [Polyangiaceae bacterium]|nr:hypothetical protein [Polyangiaceae bacterium]
MNLLARLFGTPGRRWLRAQQRLLATMAPKLTRAEQCRLYGVSVFDGQEAFEQARGAHAQRLRVLADLMDETGAATPEQAVATIREWKAKADKDVQLRAELEALKGKSDADTD